MKLLSENNILKNGKIAKIYYSNGLSTCRAVPLMLRTYADLIDEGFNIENSISFFNGSEIIWAEYDNMPIGGICFTKTTQGIIQNWISLSFTDLGWRNLGVNFICHRELEKLTIDAGIRYISSFVHVNNTSRIKSCEKVGMTAEFYRMSKKLNIGDVK